MDRRSLVAIGLAMVLLALATVTGVVLSPRWAVGALEAEAGQRLGRQFSATGASLDFSPLSIRIEGPAIAGADARSDRLMTAGALVIPVSLGQLVSRRPDWSSMALRDAEFALLINERGQASWDFPEAVAGGSLTLSLQQATFRYFDARNAQALTLANVDGTLAITQDGGVNFRGTAVINSHVATIDLALKSLPRVNDDGSPLELAIDSDAGSASFSGRIETRKVLSLAGPFSLVSREPATALRWAGLPLQDGVVLPGPLNLDGAIDSAGRAYAVRNAALTLGQFRAVGDLVADLREERPKLQASLQAETLWLDQLLPAAGSEAGSWGRAVLPLAALREVDAELSILTVRAAYGSLAFGPTRFAATLKEGRLDASGALRLTDGGTASFVAKVDAVVLPPAGSVTLRAENAALGPLIGALTGVAGLAGIGSLDVEVSASGQTQEELVSTLQGKASLSLTGGSLPAFDLGTALSAVRERILDGWTAAPGSTPIDRLDASLALSDGVATLQSGVIATPAVQLSLSGSADLLRRAIDIKAAFVPPETAPLSVPIIIQGNWAAPRIYPDIPDILNNPEGGFARLRSGDAPSGN